MSLLFWSYPFLRTRAEIKYGYLFLFFGKLKTPKSPFEIYWPLILQKYLYYQVDPKQAWFCFIEWCLSQCTKTKKNLILLRVKAVVKREQCLLATKVHVTIAETFLLACLQWFLYFVISSVIYRTRAIISRGLYTFYPISKNHFFVF